LPAPEISRPSPKSFVPPGTADEQALAKIWGEVLSLKDISLDDNFFDLGADSLSATRAFARINQFFGTNLTLREILEHPTVAAQAKMVRQNGDGRSFKLPPLVPRAKRKSPERLAV